MPPKKRRGKSKSKPRTTQSQRQSQRVTVNIGKTTVTKRKQSGKGSLPPPSHMHNLAPTFVSSGPQVDFVNLIGEISRLTKPVVQDPVPIRNPVTPLQSTLQASNAEAQQMAGEAAIRRAGPTAERFQPAPSVADERLAQQIQDQDDVVARQELAQKVFPMPTKGDGTGGGQPVAVAEGVPKRGRPFVDMNEIALGESLIKSAKAEPVVRPAQALVNTNRAEEPHGFEGSKIKGVARMKKDELQTIARQRNIDPSGLNVTQLKARLTGRAEKEPRPKKKLVKVMGL